MIFAAKRKLRRFAVYIIAQSLSDKADFEAANAKKIQIARIKSGRRVCGSHLIISAYFLKMLKMLLKASIMLLKKSEKIFPKSNLELLDEPELELEPEPPEGLVSF